MIIKRQIKLNKNNKKIMIKMKKNLNIQNKLIK